MASSSENVVDVLRLITVQQGPGEVMVALKLRMEAGLTGDQVIAGINGFEAKLKERCPEVRWVFAEPDVEA